jgi:hypothetical protein
MDNGSVDRGGSTKGGGESSTGSAPLETPRIQGLIPPPDDERLRTTVQTLIEAGGQTVAAILLYGSHVQKSSPDQWSAYDFVVLVDAYSPFFRSLGPLGHRRRPPWVLTLFSQFLPPNIISFGKSETGLPMAKCAIVSPRHLRGFLGPHSRDHFLKGRAVQKLALVWNRSPEDEAAVVSSLRVAREGVFKWVRPYLAEEFDLETFARTMLRVSYQGEIRPESSDRVDEVFRSQTRVLLAIAQESLAVAVRDGVVSQEGDRFRWKNPPGRMSRVWYSLYFNFSKVRATTRWFKYVVTFDGWIDYIIRKIQRRAGFEIKVTDRERRWPVLLLWPKFPWVVKEMLKAGRRSGPPDAKGDGP